MTDMSLTSVQIAMITLASVVAVIVMGVRNQLSVGLALVPIMHIAILSLGLDYSNEHATPFISYTCWAWTWLVSSNLASALGPSVKENTIPPIAVTGLDGMWKLSVFGTAVAAAAYNTHNDTLDYNGLCAFGLVSTILYWLPIAGRLIMTV